MKIKLQNGSAIASVRNSELPEFDLPEFTGIYKFPFVGSAEKIHRGWRASNSNCSTEDMCNITQRTEAIKRRQHSS